ncbi:MULTISPECIES: hypothetical protein, partial [unclassified Burkholderia]|uniref:hypothetical protein n=1 Tax=Burkholderia sp. LMG 13014 TaxID=2709306 RepID=UPI00163DE996
MSVDVYESGKALLNAAAYRRPAGGGAFQYGPAVMMTRASGFASRIERQPAGAGVAAAARRSMDNEERLMIRRTFLSRAIGVAAASLFARAAWAQHAGHAGMAGMDSMDD